MSTIKKLNTAIALMVPFGATVVSTVAMSPALANTRVGAGDFDLTKPASGSTFPLMFDRPVGYNAAAIAGAIQNLGSDSALYKDAIKAVPELAQANLTATLLNNALNGNTAESNSAKATIVKLINWYNTKAPNNKILTQSGATFTANNLDQPLNTIAVAFADGSISSQVSDTVYKDFANVKTVNDVMTILEKYQSGITNNYKNAFNAYANRVYATNADLTALTEYSAVKPVLDAYEEMYANGASVIRQSLLNSGSATEAAVVFFEHAVLTTEPNTAIDNGTTASNQVTEKITRFMYGNTPIAPQDSGDTHTPAKTIPGYVLKSDKTDGDVKTYYYEPVAVEKVTEYREKGTNKELAPAVGPTENFAPVKDIPNYTPSGSTENGNKKIFYYEPVTQLTTRWVTVQNGQTKDLQTPETGTDYKNSKTFPNYQLVKTETKDGVRIHTYEPMTTDFIDKTTGKPLKPTADGHQPGSPIDGYELVETKTDGGKRTHYYVPKETPKTTDFIDETTGKPISPTESGLQPGKTIPGYTLTKTENNGDKRTHYYKPTETPKTTDFIDRTTGKPLKPTAEGLQPGADIPGYRLDETVTNGDKRTHYYVPIDETKELTYWIDIDTADQLKPKEEGKKPDEEGDDIQGYELVQVIPVTEDIAKQFEAAGSNGDFKPKAGDTINVYRKLPDTPVKVTTSWESTELDENGNRKPIEGKPTIEGDFPDEEGDDVNGYTLVTIERTTEPNGDQKVVNVYRPNTDKDPVTTRYVTEKDGQVTDLINPITGEDFGDAKDFKDYVLIDKRLDPDGKTLIYVYEEKTTEWVDKDGKELKAPEKGDHRDEEGDDIKGYKLVEIIVSPDGKTIQNVYEKLPEVKTRWVTEKGGAYKDLDDPQVGEKFGEAKDFSKQNLELSHTIVSEDGTEKVYVYKEKEQPKAPATTTPSQPTTTQALPSTGEASSALATVIGMTMAGSSALGLKARKRKDEE